jgi:hypothetical protein
MRTLVLLTLAALLLLGSIFPGPAAASSKRRARKGSPNSKGSHSPAEPSESQSGILYGPGFAYALSAPKGWVMDDATGRAQGVSAVFYRRGESWVNGEAVMYANVAAKVKGEDDTLDKVIRYDFEQTKQNNPDTKAKLSTPLETGDGRQAVVYSFSMTGTGAAREQIAYIDTPKVVIMLACPHRSQRGGLP